MTVTGMLWDALPSQAQQRLRLDPPINQIHECGIRIPMSTLVDLVKQNMRDGIRDECPEGHTCVPKATEANVSIERGGDNTTSEDDSLVVRLVYRKQVRQDYIGWDKIYAVNLVAAGILDNQGRVIPE